MSTRSTVHSQADGARETGLRVTPERNEKTLENERETNSPCGERLEPARRDVCPANLT